MNGKLKTALRAWRDAEIMHAKAVLRADLPKNLERYADQIERALAVIRIIVDKGQFED